MFKNNKFRLEFLIIILIAAGIYLSFSNKDTGPSFEPVTYSQFYEMLEDGDIASIKHQAGSSSVTAMTKDGKSISSVVPSGNLIVEEALEQGIIVDIEPYENVGSPIFSQLFIVILPILLLIGFLFWMHKKQEREQKNILSKISPPSNNDIKGLVDPENNPYRLSDVAGCDEAKEEVAEIVDFLKNPDVYHRVGARSPRGILMSGPPGTGKTLLAKAIAGEASVPFFSVSGSDFIEMFVGVGAGRVRSLFEKAKQHSPAIIFIDEIDSIGRKRSGQTFGATHEQDQTLNALLVEMDGFTTNTNVVVIAATNRSDVLDDALRRPGRFDREVNVTLPDRKGREDILKVHGKNIPVALDVSWSEIAKGTPGFSGADLSNLINEAAVLAAREKKTIVTNKHFDEARDKILMGAQRGSMTNQEERKIVAYHEAGHALVAHFTPLSEPVHKISIVPRGRALGVTVQLPKEDSYNHSSDKLLADIDILMGGRAAEDVMLNVRTVGASNDFMRATVMARRMIASWGMDDDFGPVSIDGESGSDWVGSDLWSQNLKEEVDKKVQKMLKDSYKRACSLLKEHKEVLETLAQLLLEKENIDADEFERVVKEYEEKRKSSEVEQLSLPFNNQFLNKA